MKSVAVVGASGAVGAMMVRLLQERKFPVGSIKFLASERSAGKAVTFAGESHPIEPLGPGAFVHPPRHQIGPDVVSGAIVVTDLTTATQALQTIVEQGEGTKQSPAEALGAVGRRARPAVPELKKALDDPAPYLRASAALALWRMQCIGFFAAVAPRAFFHGIRPEESVAYGLQRVFALASPRGMGKSVLEHRMG